jgi:hypothetical protein
VRRIMSHMTTRAAAPPPTRRLFLVPAEPRRSDADVRRYRLARLRLEGREVGRSERFDQCRRSYD